MATAVAGTVSQRTRGKYDRAFYSGMAVAMALTVLAGFARTYYLKVFGDAPLMTGDGKAMTPLVHVHAALFTGWVLLFIAQTTLVAQHKVAVHRRLGVAGGVFAAMMVLVGALALLKAAARGAMPPGFSPALFVMLPLSNVVLFGVFVALALRMRADRETHKRLMLLAYVNILGAAVGRIPGVLSIGPLAILAFAYVFILIGIVYDVVTRQRVHPVYRWGGALLVLSVPLRLAMARTDAWKFVAEHLVALVS